MKSFICLKCNNEFITRKSIQTFCSKSCANSYTTSKRKVHDNSIFKGRMNSLKAYILGLFLSDGCLSYDKHCHRYKITIMLNDFEIIKFLNETYLINKKIYSYTSKKSNNQSYAFISTNEYDVKYLFKMGVTERKSKNIRIPQIPKIFLGALMRGIFDGDGSVYINKTNTYWNGVKKTYEYINASITTGCLEFAEDIQRILEEFEIENSIVRDCRKYCWYVKIYSKKSIQKFYKLIYKNDKLSLKRKKDLFHKMI